MQLHAQYSSEKTYNSFDEHRCVQAFELAKFIRDTSSDCDAVIVGGDFNTTPNQVTKIKYVKFRSKINVTVGFNVIQPSDWLQDDRVHRKLRRFLESPGVSPTDSFI